MKRILSGLTVLAVVLLIAAGAVSRDAGDPLTEAEAVARALAANPGLGAARSAVLAAGELTRQAALRPNPVLGLEWENIAGTGEMSGIGASEYKVALSQLFELGGKRSRRTEVARRGAELAGWDHASLRLDLVAAVRTTFLEVWLAQRECELAAGQRELDEHLAREIADRHEAGAASPADLSRARVVVSTGEIAERQAARHLARAQRRLAALWGAREIDFAGVEADYETVADEASVPPADWAARNPDTARWNAVAAAGAAEAALARALGRPDLELGAGLKREHASGDIAFVLEAGLPLPLFDRNEPAVRAAEYAQDEARALAESVAAAVAADLDVALEQRHGARDEIRILRDETIPRAREAHAATEAGHARGLFGLTDVLETRRALVDLQRLLLDSLARHHRADIRIRRLVGEIPGESPDAPPAASPEVEE